MAAVRNADADLATLLASLNEQGLTATTDVIRRLITASQRSPRRVPRVIPLPGPTRRYHRVFCPQGSSRSISRIVYV